MCTVSVVMDRYSPHIPPYWPQPWVRPTSPPLPGTRPLGPPPIDSDEKLRRLLESFRKAVAAAEEFDTLTGQPDCVDPEKATLEERVTELERQLGIER